MIAIPEENTSTFDLPRAVIIKRETFNDVMPKRQAPPRKRGSSWHTKDSI
jgi:hypothetical protein